MIKDVIEYLNNEVANIFVGGFDESDVKVDDGGLFIRILDTAQVKIDLEDENLFALVLPISDNFFQEEIEVIYDIMDNKEYIIELLNEEEEEED